MLRQETKVVAISDTHSKHNKMAAIPKCDILIHAGDATSMGHEREVRAFAAWFEKQPATYKIFIPGNHELEFERQLPASRLWFEEECPSGIMLIDQSVEVMGIKIYGSPQTPWFYDWAFNQDRKQIKKYWDAIPDDTDILVTHGPPLRVLDEVLNAIGDRHWPPQCVGCEELAEAVKRVKPDLHIFGHIHCSHGQKHQDGTSFYNVAICDETYMTSNPITVIDYIK
jgi:Icc-related predicted phosphoesterase